MRAVQSDRRARRAYRAVLGGLLALALGLTVAPLVDVVTAPRAAAVVGDVTLAGSNAPVMADSGSGRYKDRIVWLNWGAEGARLTAPASNCSPANQGSCLWTTTVTTLHDLSDRDRLEVACTMYRGNGQDVYVYRPGDYDADGLPRLYGRASGTGLVNAFRTPGNQDRHVTVGCTAELATYAAANYTGQRTAKSVTLSGLVVADAESTKATEALRVTGTPAATWRIIDRVAATCTNGNNPHQYYAAVAGGELTLSATGECAAPQFSATAVALAQGSSSLSIRLDGAQGQTAAAVGYVIGADYGDAAAGYGHGPALVQPTWTSGTTVGTSATNVLASSFTLATMAAPATRLGAQAFPNRTAPVTPDASGDTGWAVPNGTTGATTATPDEDAFTANPAITASVGLSTTYTLQARCAPAGAWVRGWLDWDGDSRFIETRDPSAKVQCAANGTANLTWSNASVASAQLGTRTLRVAISSVTEDLDGPTMSIRAGEVEDWQVTVRPAVRVTKTVNATTMPNGGTVTYTVTVSNPGSSQVTAYLVDDYSGAFDDATLHDVSSPSGTFADDGTGRFTWRVDVPAAGAVTMTYRMTMRSSAGGPGNQVLSNVVRVSTAVINGAITCDNGDQAAQQCARVDLYRAGLTIDKQAFLASDTGFTSELGSGGQLQPGTAVVWRYVVRNTGSVPLSGVVVSDAWSESRTTADGTTPTSGATTLTCPGLPPGTSVTLGTLAAGATVTCTATRAVEPYP
ncbi:conserved repeat domain protein [Cellulomonas flavigena DSM 20109]|uniref:Conserved repeat domain protein n=1 Tax=Cellulomonas flavigena (strain ATCC 482 / DSM 20109 / BCRC 11376 / JCM 18109 / NBRC 3775 / NCIMB 8073 / NRS 134) TaxID=446466 RepID=D5UIW0_CELFN|nr:CshA/CshB family fibrillar adhesin-related protein [Cellulomonas flavigena]ADG75526.1 conserved repeat domain protein [Cellulomonas flavigena DSM 20109]